MRNLFIYSLLCLFLCSCSKLTVYQSTIQQGNVLSAATQLQLGMSKMQVANLLGSPITANNLASQRWDYVYTIQPGGQHKIEQQTLNLYFSNDRLVKIVGPTTRTFAP